MEKNRNLIIYPEGTRSLNGEMGLFKRGPAMFSAELNLPIVPVHIHGTYKSLPKGRVFPKPKRITVTIGEPIDPLHFKAKLIEEKKNPKELYSSLTGELNRRIQLLKLSQPL